MSHYLRRIAKFYLAQPYWNYKGAFPYFNHKVFFPKHSTTFIKAVEEGVYEHENVSLMQALIKPDSIIFDIGANIGLMAIPLLKHDNTISVISIEASPNTVPFLKKTNALHSYKGRWIIIDKAVSDQLGKVSFHLASSANGAFDGIKNTNRIEVKRTVEVDCITIDSIWESLNKRSVSFIKIDIEGADLLALKGAVNCITNCKPVILMEWNQINIKAFELSNEDIVAFVDKINYSIFALPTLNKIETTSQLDVFGKLTENYLLVPNNSVKK